MAAQHQQLTQHGATILRPDEARATDVRGKQLRVAEFLAQHSLDALLLQQAHNVAWMTAGADVGRGGSTQTIASAFVTADARVIVTNNVDSPLLFERELYGLGFQLKERVWQEPHDELVRDLCRGRRVASDTGVCGSTDVSHQLRNIRLPLTDLECARLRRLGRVAAHAVEAGGRNITAGRTEAEVAGEVAHRLLKHTVIPERLQVAADGRSERYRHWSYGNHPIERFATVSCVARRWGLCVGATRTDAIGEAGRELQQTHRQLALMHATGMFFSRNGRDFEDLWEKVHRIYEKSGLPHEWRLADQADVIEYDPVSASLVADRDLTLVAPVAVFWHPSVGPTLAGDTVLIRENSTELLTPINRWPKLTVSVRGVAVPCADLLVQPGVSHSRPHDPSETAAIDDLDEPDDSSMDTVWELQALDDDSVLDESESVYSEDSVLE